MNGHTPGPWRVLAEPQDSERRARVLSKEGGIAILCVNRQLGDPGPSAQELANARLIAAAPELLAACETARRRLWEALGGGDDADNTARAKSAVKFLDAAIAKATWEAA